MSIAKTLLAAAAADRIARLKATYIASIQSRYATMLDRLQAPDGASPELRAVLAEVRSEVSITMREGDAFPIVSVPTVIIRQAVAAGVMHKNYIGKVSVGNCYTVHADGECKWTASDLDQYRPYIEWQAWVDAAKAAKEAGLD